MEKTYWAVFTKDGLVLCDARLPIFWLRKIAKSWAKEHGFSDYEYEIKKVSITITD